MARQPDYKVSLLDKVTSRRNPEAGAGWVNENGSISIQLNLCVSISSNPDLVITLFPNEIKPAAKKTASRRFSMGKEVSTHDDSIPF